jgi:hypothetical protein
VELGIFQVSYYDGDGGTGEAQILHIPWETFIQSSTDPDVSVSVGIQCVRMHMRDADAILSQYSVTWSAHDYGSLVKMFHALPGAARDAFSRYAADHAGKGPPTWADCRAASPGYTSEWDNAEYVGQYWSGSGPVTMGGLLAIAALALVLALAG